MEWLTMGRLIFLMMMVMCFGLSQSENKLCQMCKCTKSNINETQIDIDCTDTSAVQEVLYQQSSWIDENNITVPYARVILKDSKLGDIVTPFLPSTLTYLDLSRNRINKIKLECFTELQSMDTLILSDNNISLLKPDVFKSKRLDGENYPLRCKTLKLDTNDLHTLDQDVFEHVDQILEVLDLSYNPFNVLDIQTTIAIGSIIYFKELYLRFTHIKELPDHFLHTPRHLKLLDLCGNNFSKIPIGLSEAQALETLYFNNNSITTESTFPNISTLKVLYLCYNIKLEDIGARALSTLEHLVELHICNIKLNHIDPAALSRVEVDSKSVVWPPHCIYIIRDIILCILCFLISFFIIALLLAKMDKLQNRANQVYNSLLKLMFNTLIRRVVLAFAVRRWRHDDIKFCILLTMLLSVVTMGGKFNFFLIRIFVKKIFEYRTILIRITGRKKFVSFVLFVLFVLSVLFVLLLLFVGLVLFLMFKLSYYFACWLGNTLYI